VCITGKVSHSHWDIKILTVHIYFSVNIIRIRAIDIQGFINGTIKTPPVLGNWVAYKI